MPYIQYIGLKFLEQVMEVMEVHVYARVFENRMEQMWTPCRLWNDGMESKGFRANIDKTKMMKCQYRSGQGNNYWKYSCGVGKKEWQVDIITILAFFALNVQVAGRWIQWWKRRLRLDNKEILNCCEILLLERYGNSLSYLAYWQVMKHRGDIKEKCTELAYRVSWYIW